MVVAGTAVLPLFKVEFSAEKVPECAVSISMHIRQAAEHFVAVTNMPIEVVVYGLHSAVNGQQAVSQVWDESQGSLHRSVKLQECTWSAATFQMVIKLVPFTSDSGDQLQNLRQQEAKM